MAGVGWPICRRLHPPVVERNGKGHLSRSYRTIDHGGWRGQQRLSDPERCAGSQNLSHWHEGHGRGFELVEAKTVERFVAVHFAQLNGYLHFAGLEVGLLLNFQTWPLKDGGIKRVVHTKNGLPRRLIFPDILPGRLVGVANLGIQAAAIRCLKEKFEFHF